MILFLTSVCIVFWIVLSSVINICSPCRQMTHTLISMYKYIEVEKLVFLFYKYILSKETVIWLDLFCGLAMR